MIALINDLLNVTRIEEGRFLYQLEPVQLEDIVGQVLEGLKETADLKNIKIKIERPKELLPPVMVDKEKMGIAVQNLVDNAIKYTPANGKVTIVLDKKDNQVFFKITDSGVGIPQDQQDRIFPSFLEAAMLFGWKQKDLAWVCILLKILLNRIKERFGLNQKKGQEQLFTLPFPLPHRQFLKLGVKYKTYEQESFNY